MDRISQVEVFQADVPLKEPFVISLETITTARNIVICIHSEKGLKGWGECSPYPTILGETQQSCLAAARQLAVLLPGQAVSAINHNLQLLDQALAKNYCVKSAFDMALYDLAAKEAGLPLYAYLGGTNTGKLRTDMTIGIGSPEKMSATARQLMDQGFDTLKIKLGTTYDEDIQRMEAIQASISDQVKVRLDANQGWDKPTALRILKKLSSLSLDIEWCEAPIPAWDLAGLAQLSRLSPVPLMADESLFDHRDAIRHVRRQACPYFNIKLAKSGGIHNARKIVAIGEGAGISLQVGCFSETRLGITALAHFVLAHPSIQAYDMDSFLMLSEDPVEGGIQYEEGGWIRVTDEVGLGCEFVRRP
jgi:L-alanine-DL-glutamate epimerase-like enolase superfamily enzyme